MTGILITALMGFFLLPQSEALTNPATMPATGAFPHYSVKVTAYNAVPEQTDGSPHITASGAYANPEVVAARSRDLKDQLPFGTVIVLKYSPSSKNCGFATVEELIGYRVIADSMHSRKRNQIDLLFDARDTVSVGGKATNPSIALGVCDAVIIRVVGKVDIENIPKTQAELARLVAGELAVR